MQANSFKKMRTKIEEKYESFNSNELKDLFTYLQKELKEWDLAELFVEIREAKDVMNEGEPEFDKKVIEELER